MSVPARLLPLLLAALTLPVSQLLFPGCDTIIDWPVQKVVVKSQPVGAEVFVNGHSVGRTPVTAVVSRWGMHRVRIEMPGYKPFEVPLEKRFNGAAEGNIFIGGVWIIVDAMTGAVFWLDVPANRRRELNPYDRFPEFRLGNPEVTISTMLKPNLAARRVGQMERQ
jgi:hypothetical protein